MKDYQGKKFYLKGIEKVRDYTYWQIEEYKEIKTFKMTKNYKDYLEEKRRKEIEHYIVCLRHKLDYQMKKYGEVDELDYQEFIRLINGK